MLMGCTQVTDNNISAPLYGTKITRVVRNYLESSNTLFSELWSFHPLPGYWNLSIQFRRRKKNETVEWASDFLGVLIQIQSKKLDFGKHLPTSSHCAIEMESDDRWPVYLHRTNFCFCLVFLKLQWRHRSDTWNYSEAWDIIFLVEELENAVPVRFFMEEKDVIKIHRKGIKYYSENEIKIKKHLIIYFVVKSSKLTRKLCLNTVAIISTLV